MVGGPPEPETGPLAVVPVDAPAAPTRLRRAAGRPARRAPGRRRPAAARPLAEPAPAGVRAWAATPRPVVLRCGLPRPAELNPTSALIEVNGVRWLPLTDPGPGHHQLRGRRPAGVRRADRVGRGGQRADPGVSEPSGRVAGHPGRGALTRNETRLAAVISPVYILWSW